MDQIDRDILAILESNARISYKDLAEKVALSANSVSERVRKLQEQGVIRCFSTEIDPAVFDLKLQALIEVKMESATTAELFQTRAAATRGVVRALVTTGRYDWVLEVNARDHNDLQRIIEALRAGNLVRDTYTRVIVSDKRFPLIERARKKLK